MIRRLLVVAVALAPAAWLVDRLLARSRLRDGQGVETLEMLAVVDAPADRTWEVLADIPRQAEWMREMKRVRVDTPGPVRVGTRAEALVRILGITAADPVEVTTFEPPHRYAIRHLGLVSGRGEITLQPGADGTTTIVRWEERLGPPVLPALGSVAAAPVLRSIFQADLHRFKRLVETGSADA